MGGIDPFQRHQSDKIRDVNIDLCLELEQIVHRLFRIIIQGVVIDPVLPSHIHPLFFGRVQLDLLVPIGGRFEYYFLQIADELFHAVTAVYSLDGNILLGFGLASSGRIVLTLQLLHLLQQLLQLFVGEGIILIQKIRLICLGQILCLQKMGSLLGRGRFRLGRIGIIFGFDRLGVVRCV